MPNCVLAAFQTTSLSPSTQTVTVGTPFSVNVVASGIGSPNAYGIQAWVTFDPTKLQVVSISTAPSSPWTGVFANTYDNTAGTLTYGATGSLVGGTVTAATIVFNPIASGTTPISFHDVDEYMFGYGRYGVNGLAHGASVTISAPLVTQTLTLLGASGAPGEFAPNVEYYNPVTGNWQPAYITSYAAEGHPSGHPWGNISGTNNWINYKSDGASDPGSGSTDPNHAIDNTFWYLYRVRFTVPSDAIDPTMTFSIKADNLVQVAINGTLVGGETVTVNNTPTDHVIEGQANQLNADAVFSQAIHPGENTITLNVGDYGGLNGFNFRIDLSMLASQPLEVVPVNPDTTAPVITAPADIVAEATSPAGAPVTFSASAVDDVDGPVNVVANPASGSTFAIATTAVGLAASDAAGNTATASFNITVQDTTPPTLAVPSTTTAEATSAEGATVSYAEATANDAVGVTSITYSQASGTQFPLGTTSVAVEAQDAAGNTSSGAFDVTVQDTTAPALSVPASVTAEATGAGGAPVSYAAATATDAVGVASITYSQNSGTQFPLGATTVHVTAKDAAGNTSTGAFSVTVQDTTAPALHVPANQTLEATSADGAVATFSASATDAVTASPTIVYSQASGSTFPLGTTTVNVSAKDAAGNTSNGSFTITVRDTTAPALTVPANLTLEATGAAGAVANFSASATDAVTSSPTITYSVASGSVFAIGTTTVNVTAKDAAGNASNGSFTVTVRDTTAPAITGLAPSTATLWPPNHQMVAIQLSTAANDLVGVTSLKIVNVTSSEPDNGLGDGDTAHDIVITGDLTLSLRAERGGKGPGRTYTIVVEASDAAGNKSTSVCAVSVPNSQGKGQGKK